MAKYANVRLTSIEIDKTLAEIAKANIAKANQETMIDLLNSDALEIETAGLGIYDIIFVDGAKGKYRAYFNKYKDSLRKVASMFLTTCFSGARLPIRKRSSAATGVN